MRSKTGPTTGSRCSEATTKPLRSHYEATTKPLRSHYKATTKPLRSHYKATTCLYKIAQHPIANACTKLLSSPSLMRPSLMPVRKSRFWGSGRAKSHKYKIYVPFSKVFLQKKSPRAFGNFLRDFWHSRHISPFVHGRESNMHALNPARSAGKNFRFWGSGRA